MKMIGLVFAALSLVLAGCATRPKVDPHIDWNQRIGSYKYDQAVVELGKPDVVGESSEGKMAEWITRRSSRVSFGFGVGHGMYGRHSATGVGVGTSVSQPPGGEYLRLTFGQDGNLKAWSKVRR